MENETMEQPHNYGFAPPPTKDEIADNAALQARALGMSRTLNDQMRGLGILSEAEKSALQRKAAGFPND